METTSHATSVENHNEGATEVIDQEDLSMRMRKLLNLDPLDEEVENFLSNKTWFSKKPTNGNFQERKCRRRRHNRGLTLLLRSLKLWNNFTTGLAPKSPYLWYRWSNLNFPKQRNGGWRNPGLSWRKMHSKTPRISMNKPLTRCKPT